MHTGVQGGLDFFLSATKMHIILGCIWVVETFPFLTKYAKSVPNGFIG
jgi:hypothetical protein